MKNEGGVPVKSSALTEKIGHTTQQKNTYDIICSFTSATYMALRFHDRTKPYRISCENTITYGIGMKCRSHMGRTENKSDL